MQKNLNCRWPHEISEKESRLEVKGSKGSECLRKRVTGHGKACLLALHHVKDAGSKLA